MLFQKPIRILSAHPYVPITCITSSWSGNGQRPARTHTCCCRSSPGRNADCARILRWSPRQARYYASASNLSPQHPSSPATDHVWPSSPHPTPYEVLAHPRDARYNKAVFYELVKVYHPDRSRTGAGSFLPQYVRLERYHLVVEAHEILSDDAKRRAYDLYGAGWDGSRTMHDLSREADRAWREKPGNASRNATWEDWERWRRERDGQAPPQTPVFMSNQLFALVLCSFVVMGSFTQARRASARTLDLIEVREKRHADISDNLRQLQEEQAPLSRDERVQSFLRQRDSWNLV